MSGGRAPILTRQEGVIFKACKFALVIFPGNVKVSCRRGEGGEGERRKSGFGFPHPSAVGP